MPEPGINVYASVLAEPGTFLDVDASVLAMLHVNDLTRITRRSTKPNPPGAQA